MQGRVVASDEKRVQGGLLRRRAQLGLCAMLGAAACAPISYAEHVRSAERALATAEAADAERRAPYELTLSRLYLDKAREESGAARYAVAIDLLQRAEQSAVRARVLASARGAGSRE